MHNVVICIGSNVTECHKEMTQAIEWLMSVLVNSRSTSPYYTPPEGLDTGNTPFLNAVMEGDTHLTSTQLETEFKNYELQRGRTAAHKAQKHIIIDLDLVCYDNEILRPEEFATAYFRTGYLSLYPQSNHSGT